MPTPWSEISTIKWPSAPLRVRDVDALAGGREFVRVAHHVPENLLEPRRVRLNMMPLGVEMKLDVAQSLLATEIHRVANQEVRVDRFKMKLQRSAGDAREVEQVINQPRFQLHIAADRLNVVLHFAGKILEALRAAKR